MKHMRTASLLQCCLHIENVLCAALLNNEKKG